MAEAALYGAGTTRDVNRFFAYAQRGCGGNDGRSCMLVATGYRFAIGTAEDLSKSLEYNDRSCRAGFAIGCHNLGIQYRDGVGVGKDPGHALELFELACDRGSALGCGSLAREMPDGMVPEDRAATALILLVHDCDPTRNPDPRVCTVAAKMFEAGRGTANDLARAKQLYEAACKRGDHAACDPRARR
jgi:TPR repeat protein